MWEDETTSYFQDKLDQFTTALKRVQKGEELRRDIQRQEELIEALTNLSRDLKKRSWNRPKKV